MLPFAVRVSCFFAVILPTPAAASAPGGRYVVTNGGTSNGTVYDTKTRLTWQQTISSISYTWADAKTYCAGVGSSLGGTGWRLPTTEQLKSIIDPSQASPSIDSTVFPSTPASPFWSASSLANSPSGRWVVNFDNGYTYGSSITDRSNVRCVR